MEPFTLDKSKLLREMEKKYKFLTVMANKSGLMVQNMKETGEMAKLKGEEHLTMKTKTYTLVSL